MVKEIDYTTISYVIEVSVLWIDPRPALSPFPSR